MQGSTSKTSIKDARREAETLPAKRPGHTCSQTAREPTRHAAAEGKAQEGPALAHRDVLPDSHLEHEASAAATPAPQSRGVTSGWVCCRCKSCVL